MGSSPPSTSPEDPPREGGAQVSVWFFLFATPTLFAPVAPTWVRFGVFGLGLVAIAVGGVYFTREIRHRRAQRPE